VGSEPPSRPEPAAMGDSPPTLPPGGDAPGPVTSQYSCDPRFDPDEEAADGVG
jgi:hypothetical protein